MEHYDIIIVGGGISGLYLSYKINNKKVLLIEKSNNLGGRIFTIKNKINNNNYVIEAGAARFSNNDQFLLDLLADLGILNKKEQITSDFEYWDKDDGKLSSIKIYFYTLLKYTTTQQRQN